MLNAITLLCCLQENNEEPVVLRLIYLSVTIIVVARIIFFLLSRVFCLFEIGYIKYIKKQLLFNHIYIFKKALSIEDKTILSQNIKFYNNLSIKHKTYFEHRVYKTMHHIEFIGKQLEVSNEMKLIISATLVKLTFGLRGYKIGSVERVLIYPEAYYSQINKTFHKGEFNLGYKALVLSWEDVLHGYHIEDDNLNLAVHEFIHAIHFYYMSVRSRNSSAAIFVDSFYELTQYLDQNSLVKEKLVNSRYLRDYAYTNQFEFLAVIIETFIETPQEFESQFPKMYKKVKGMLNFNFEGY